MFVDEAVIGFPSNEPVALTDEPLRPVKVDVGTVILDWVGSYFPTVVQIKTSSTYWINLSLVSSLTLLPIETPL